MSSQSSPLSEVLYPEIEPHTTGNLQVSPLHTIAWERCGNPQGQSVIVIHGGPGGGSQPSYRQYFNPETAPARETVEVANLPKFVNVEISVIAAV